MDNKKKKTFIRYVFLLALMGVTVYLVLKSLDISMLSSVIAMVKKEYLLVGGIAVILYIILEGVILQVIINEQYKLKSHFVGFRLAIMGFYYNLVTPFASGSQPIQIYVLNKYKVPLSKSTGIITNKTILYQVVITLYCSLFIFLNINKFFNIVPVADNLFMGIVMMIIGIIISAIATVLYLGAGLGSGPRDGLMLALNKKFSKPVGAIRMCIELTVLVCGWILGGSVGLGTIISAFGLGYAIQIGFKICKINSKEIKHRIIRDDIDYIKNIIEQRKNLQENKEYITKDCNDNK